MPEGSAEAEAPSASPRPWQRPRAVVLLLLLAVACAYANALSNDFTYDDIPVVRDNRNLRGVDRIPALWTGSWWDPDSPYRHYRPVTLTSFALDHACWGRAPFGYHLTNVLLHALACVLLYRLLLALFRRPDLAFVAALLFAIHPLHTDAVSSIVGRAEVLAGVGVLLALLAHRQALTATGGRRWVWCAAAAVATLLGSLAKESALVAPGLLLAADLCAPVPGTRGRTLAGVTAGAGAIAVFFALRFAVLGTLGAGYAIYTEMGVDAGVRIPRALAALGHGLRLHVAPWPLSADTAVNQRADLLPIPWSDPAVWGSVLALLALVGLAVRCRRNAGPLPFGAAWFLLAVVPGCNLFVQIGIVFAERLFYIASIGPLLLLAEGLLRLRGDSDDGRHAAARRLAFVVLLTIVGAGGALLTVSRNEVWRNNLSLFEDMTAQDEGNPTGWIGLADEWRERGQLAEALAAADRAVGLAPGNANAWTCLATAAFAAGDGARAVAAWDQAIALLDRAHFHRRRSAARLLVGDVAGARADLDVARDRRPDDPEVWIDLGIFWSRADAPRDLARAAAAYAQALELAPDHPRAWYNRGLDAWERADFPAALADLERAVELEPDFPGAALAAARAALRAEQHRAEAAARLDARIEATGGSVEEWRTLAALYRALDQPEQLAEVQRRLRDRGLPDLTQEPGPK